MTAETFSQAYNVTLYYWLKNYVCLNTNISLIFQLYHAHHAVLLLEETGKNGPVANHWQTWLNIDKAILGCIEYT